MKSIFRPKSCTLETHSFQSWFWFFLYKAAFERYRQGMGVALFWLIASLPYLIFRFIFVAGLMGYPSPFIFLPESGMAYLLQNTYVSQAISVGLEAIIMSLAVIARNNWIQQELTKSLAAQKNFGRKSKILGRKPKIRYSS